MCGSCVGLVVGLSDCVIGQWQGKLIKSRRVQLIPRTQQMAYNWQRQGKSARLVERRSYCTDEGLSD